MPRTRSQHLHLSHISFDDSKNMKLLYGIRVTRDFVNKMAMFFLPIFLYKIGSETNLLSFLPFSSFQKGMLAISFYYVIYGAVGASTAIYFGKLLGKIGYQRSFVLSLILRTLMFATLYFANIHPTYILIASVVDGVNAQLFWPGYFSLLSKTAHKSNMGKDLSLIQFLLQLVAVISPAISGAIAFIVGFEYLFLIGIAINLLSSVFALMMDVKTHENNVSFANFLIWIKDRRFLKQGIANAARNTNDTVIYLWPLYIFFLLGSVDRVGYLYTFSLFLAMLFTFFIGKYIDHHKNKKPFYLSGGFISFLWIARTQVFDVWGIALVDTFDKLATNVYALFFDSMFMKRGKGHLSDEYFTYLELILNINRVIFWSMFGVFFIFFSSWNSLFIFAGVTVLVGLLISEKKPDYV
ncbi:MFS transporter [Candidatus Woesebacteria bacterium]|nr:MFS transporter [Candidatus Woesebacteria bacterium]